jgi:hypothetical protein
LRDHYGEHFGDCRAKNRDPDMTDAIDDLAQLKVRLSELESRIEIANRMASYGPLVDASLAEETAELWTEDGSYDAQLDRFTGRLELSEMVGGKLHQQLITGGGGHFVGVPYIELRGDYATALTHALLLVQRPVEDKFEVWRVTATRWEWQRIVGRWHVVSRVNRKLDGSEAARAIFKGVLQKPAPPQQR